MCFGPMRAVLLNKLHFTGPLSVTVKRQIALETMAGKEFIKSVAADMAYMLPNHA